VWGCLRLVAYNNQEQYDRLGHNTHNRLTTCTLQVGNFNGLLLLHYKPSTNYASVCF
jgi:hypothetical protein